MKNDCRNVKSHFQMTLSLSSTSSLLKLPIIDVTVTRRSSVFSQSSVQISAGLIDISDQAAAASDLINCSLSLGWSLSLTLVSSFRKVLMGL